MVLDKGTCLRYYKRKDVQKALVEHAHDKEIGIRYGLGFGKRPDILAYPNDILELAKRGATSFHASEELWDNPLCLSSEMTRKELDELRIGWDLVLDIDCKFVEYSKIAAELIIKFFSYLGVKDFSLKFSGNKGFHLGIPFNAFPQKIGNEETKKLFPEAAKKIAYYIKENIKEELGKRIMQLEKNNFSEIITKTEIKNIGEIIYYINDELGTKIPFLNVEPFLEIDTVLISSRHLYRMPYSLHEKSGLVSLPIDPKKLNLFEKSMAHPDKLLSPTLKFINRNILTESARTLLVQSLDYETKQVYETKEIESRKNISEKEKFVIKSPIKEDFFPPCILKILGGLDDGKKRAIFILSNYLGKIGWNKSEIENYLLSWNRNKNQNPLRENYIQGQLRYFKPGNKLPPNCNNESYYSGLSICSPSFGCKKIKNPVNYTIIRWKNHLENKEKEEKDLAKKLRKEVRKKKLIERELKKKEELKEKKCD